MSVPWSRCIVPRATVHSLPSSFEVVSAYAVNGITIRSILACLIPRLDFLQAKKINCILLNKVFLDNQFTKPLLRRISYKAQALATGNEVGLCYTVKARCVDAIGAIRIVRALLSLDFSALGLNLSLRIADCSLVLLKIMETAQRRNVKNWQMCSTYDSSERSFLKTRPNRAYVYEEIGERSAPSKVNCEIDIRSVMLPSEKRKRSRTERFCIAANEERENVPSKKAKLSQALEDDERVAIRVLATMFEL